ncbi:glycosyltransferase family 2 protein [Anaeromyxobacter terrae]|uniref:glycosyltransferase family 2 protein n=1 Tax=Anaeromyxobacter terrae TaxID=2925406 RepID=UPI001F5A9AB8|nr:glycosyltransferase family 2 protein [Anaeromyxobacter sp. SG22]
MRLGGFVIHGDATATLGPCLDGLVAVCDEVVAVDCGSRNGSAEIARARGVRRLEHPWEGFGAARAAAAEALRGCDWLLFLDSDERLTPEAIAVLRRWRASEPRVARYSLPVRDWAELPGKRFLYRVEWHVRLVRADAARWDPSMIVHEALPPAETERLDAVIEHRFATSITARFAKGERYAMLWALRFADAERSVKPAWLQRPFHVLRDCVAKGALFRGGLTAVRLAWAVSRYHSRKYTLLAEVRAGAHPELVAAFRASRYREIFERL